MTIILIIKLYRYFKIPNILYMLLYAQIKHTVDKLIVEIK